MTLPARFQLNPATIVETLGKKFPVLYQHKAAFFRPDLHFKRAVPAVFVQRCASVNLKMKNPAATRLDSGRINQYFVPATCTSGCKPEEARRPGSVFKDPYPFENTSGGVTPRWHNTRSVELSAAGAESSGLSPEASAVGRFAR